jgi:Family of unknown function (DUF5908)
MPIVIDEVVIHVEVQPAAPGAGSAPAPAGADRQTLIAEVVEQVLEALERRQEP